MRFFFLVPLVVGTIFSLPAFPSERWVVYGKAFEDLASISKMGPPGVRHGLEIRPLEGGIEGIAPVQGNIFSFESLLFSWRGSVLRGTHPVFVFSDSGNGKTKQFLLKSGSRKIRISQNFLRLKKGKSYRWYLGRREGEKIVGQSRVFFFSVLDAEEEKRLRAEVKRLESLALKAEEKLFIQSQIYYDFNLLHDMVRLLEKLYTMHPVLPVKKLLYLGYARLGRHREAKRYIWE